MREERKEIQNCIYYRHCACIRLALCDRCGLAHAREPFGVQWIPMVDGIEDELDPG